MKKKNPKTSKHGNQKLRKPPRMQRKRGMFQAVQQPNSRKFRKNKQGK